MTTTLVERIRESVPGIRGTLTPDADLSRITWFRVGGPAEALFMPADEAELARVLSSLEEEVPVLVLGLGSNLLVRDGGIPGLVIRLSGKGFGRIDVADNQTIHVGTAVPDLRLAKTAAEAGIAGFSFYRGIPGCVGGALRMNAGAHGGETRDLLVEAHALDRQGNRHILSNADLGYAYRHCSAPQDYIFTKAVYRGRSGNPALLREEMAEVARYREDVQPVKERTGGSTFKNPPGHSAWRVIDEAGFRGYRVGGAQMSEKHCNFMINTGSASALDLETLGETVRAGVLDRSGIRLEWEIRRLGKFAPGESVRPMPGRS